LLQSIHALQSYQPGNQRSQTQSAQAAILGIFASTDAFRKLIGDFRALQVPAGDSGEINQLLNRGENVFSYLSRASADIQSALDPALSSTARLRFVDEAQTAMKELATKAFPA
jgi:hypothetical protein